MAMQEEEPEFLPFDFVYAGRRALKVPSQVRRFFASLTVGLLTVLCLPANR